MAQINLNRLGAALVLAAAFSSAATAAEAPAVPSVQTEYTALAGKIDQLALQKKTMAESQRTRRILGLPENTGETSAQQKTFDKSLDETAQKILVARGLASGDIQALITGIKAIAPQPAYITLAEQHIRFVPACRDGTLAASATKGEKMSPQIAECAAAKSAAEAELAKTKELSQPLPQNETATTAPARLSFTPAAMLGMLLGGTVLLSGIGYGVGYGIRKIASKSGTIPDENKKAAEPRKPKGFNDRL